MNPKVFISHASEDKERFVIPFATQLRENGLDAWVDRWEMYPGDSLVDKIFEEGIGQAQAFIIVLSQNSIKKLWVKEELNTAVVKRIEKGTKIIPIVLDNSTVPESLLSTVWVKIQDISHYDAEFKSIVSSIYEHRDKPTLGSPPPYVQTIVEKISDLTKIDSILLKLAGEKAIEIGDRLIQTTAILSEASSLGISRHDFFESLTILGDRYYFELNRRAGGEPTEPELKMLTRGGIPHFSITLYGFDEYAKAFIANYDSIMRDVLLQIANYNKSDDASIALALNQPLFVIDHILELLDSKQLIRVSKVLGPVIHFMNPSPEIRRILENS
jgi:TIR domain